MNNIIEVKNYGKSFGHQEVLKNINFNVKKGQFHGFIGPNGAGKTTFIKSLINAISTYEGTILINGHNAKDIEGKRLIGYIPERLDFPKHFTVLNYLISYGIMSDMKTKVVKEKAMKYLREFEMFHFANHKVKSLSSGQKKKILVIQSLMHEPQLFVLDEPVANIDLDSREFIFKVFKKLQDEGRTIFITSHILAELDKYIDSVTVISNNTVKYSGTIKEYNDNQDTVGQRYIVKASDYSKLIEWCQENDIKGAKHDNYIEIYLTSPRQQTLAIMNFANDNDINIDTISKEDLSLAHIYRESINKKGDK